MMDYVILVGSNNAHALVEFTRCLPRLMSELSPFLKRIKSTPLHRLGWLILTLQRNHRHRRRRMGRHGVEFLMTLATVGGFVNVSLDKVFIMPGDKGEPVDWPIVPRLIDLIVEYRVLRLCSGHGLAKGVVKDALKFNEAISLPAVEGALAKPTRRSTRLQSGGQESRSDVTIRQPSQVSEASAAQTIWVDLRPCGGACGRSVGIRLPSWLVDY